jgi:probable F420-dependent oxidoreductase
MQWGIAFASTAFPAPDAAITMARAAERAGFESLWCPEHVVVAVGDGVTPYRASADGTMDRLWRRGGIPDPLIWLAFVAGSTGTIQLGTNVLIVPEHQSVVLAKSVASLDALSGGRVQLGIGVGELPEEYEAVGMDFTNRGRRMDEAIEVMRLLWSEEVATFDGAFTRFENVRCDPSPVRGSVPLHIGGVSPAALRRAGVHGDGYFPFVGAVGQDLLDALERVFDGVRAEAEKAGRDPDTIELTAGGARTVADAERFADLGVDRLVIALRAKEGAELEDEIAAFGADVIAPTRDL